MQKYKKVAVVKEIFDKMRKKRTIIPIFFSVNGNFGK